MKIRCETGSGARTDVDVLIVPLFEKSKPEKDSPLEQALRSLPKDAFSGKAEQCRLVPKVNGVKAKAMLLLGLGPREKFTLSKLRNAVAAATRHPAFHQMKLSSLAVELHGLLDELDWKRSVALPGGVSTAKQTMAFWVGQGVTEGLLLGTYCFERYMSEKGGKRRHRPQRALFLVPREARDDLTRGLELGRAVADGMGLCADLCNAPNADMKPAHLAAATREASKGIANLTCRVIERPELEAMGAGGILAVNAAGSRGDLAARLICLEYRGGSPSQKPVCFIGKGVTVDKGGYCIKPDNPMAGFKMDMGGAAAVISATIAIAKTGLPLNLVTLAPATDNLISDEAYLPGDVVKMLSGMTVEVLNTDAEGRMILADALTYAQKHYKPEVILDLATLTGAKMMTLGDMIYAVMTPDDALSAEIGIAATDADELCWRLPLPDEYDSYVDSKIADVANVGGKYAGAITAGLFLKRFVEPGLAWAHLDIAGMPQRHATKRKASEPEKGAVGALVRSLVCFARNRVGV
ncbi:MAG: leucyl aminopeptidase [Planctomycetes bacterium]|nr:leucyl aminopeptidase [Planctomycetota bacterium]NUQ35341.1 leucyl aminopeptidase [Planctomycetaceae bacterium]